MFVWPVNFMFRINLAFNFTLREAVSVFEALRGKKQRVAPLDLAPRIHNHLSNRMGGRSSATSELCVSSEKLFYYTHAVETNNQSSNDESNNTNYQDIVLLSDLECTNDQEDDNGSSQEAIVDKYDIDQCHKLKEDKSFILSSVDDVLHLELAAMCWDGYFPLKTYDQILQRRAQECAYLRGYGFPLDAPSHETFLSKLAANQLEINYMNAKSVTVLLVGGGNESLPLFAFVSIFRSLLYDPRVSPYLMINWEHPNKPPKFERRFNNEIHAGSWHFKTSRECSQTDLQNLIEDSTMRFTRAVGTQRLQRSAYMI
jgi:hypothetical protein